MPDSVPAMRLQDMPPESARFCLALERFCRETLETPLDGQHLVVAYSGGADSKALLLALHALQPRLRLTVHAATLDHNLRPESAQEVAQAATLCASLGVPFHAGSVDVQALARVEGCGLEEAGRKARLAFLESVRLETGAAWVAYGHHLNDLAEDSLMRLMRGAAWPSLAGMAGVAAERGVLRPLLLTPRSDIEAFLRSLGVTWTSDAMNEDTAYRRNRIRKHLLPLFLEENPSFLETVARRWRLARYDASFWDAALAEMTISETEDSLILDKSVLRGAPKPLRLRKYHALIRSLGPGETPSALLESLDAVWARGEGGKVVQFPGNKIATVRGGGIRFSKKS